MDPSPARRRAGRRFPEQLDSLSEDELAALLEGCSADGCSAEIADLVEELPQLVGMKEVLADLRKTNLALVEATRAAVDAREREADNAAATRNALADSLDAYFRRADLPKTDRGHSLGASRGAAAAATWTFRGSESRRRRGCDIPWERVAAPPRLRHSVATSRGAAAAATWTFRRGQRASRPARRRYDAALNDAGRLAPADPAADASRRHAAKAADADAASMALADAWHDKGCKAVDAFLEAFLETRAAFHEQTALAGLAERRASDLP